jgi:hypothetical protein
MGDLPRVETSQPVQLVDANDLQVCDITSNAPTGTESGIVVRNIPSGTQAIAGTITASPTGTYTVTGLTLPSMPATQTVAGTVTAVPFGTYTAAINLNSFKSKGTNTTTTVQPTGTATLIVNVNANRAGLLIYNAGSVVVYIGQSSSVTTSNGIPLAVNASLEDTRSKDSWYAITDGGTGNLRVIETVI